METSNYIALSRQAALRREMATVAQNLANLETPAYRGESMMFVEYLKRSDGSELGPMSFVQDISTVRNLQPGPMTRTENPLDLAIRGNAYFTIETDDGPRFTRNGSFRLNEQGEVVTSDGQRLLDENNGPIVIPPTASEIEVAGDGIISTELGELTRLKLAAFENDQALRKQADSLYDAGDQPVRQPQNATVLQGMLEGSNVEGVLEMSRMIELVRSYQNAGKFAEGEHERLLRMIRTLVSSN